MKPNRQSSPDGFVRRRRGQIVIGGDKQDIVPERFLISGSEDEAVTTLGSAIDAHNAIQSGSDNEVRDALSTLSIDDDVSKARGPRKPRKKDRDPSKSKKHPLRRKIIKRAIILIILVILGIAGFLIVKANSDFANVFKGGNLLSLIAPGTPLKTDSEGRTNILIFGTSQDDAAHQDASGGGGLWLTDSIELMSIDQHNKTVKLVGIPRDLWVAIESCEVGDYAKINAVYECGANLLNSDGTPGSNYASQDSAGAQSLMTVIQEVTGITPQYYIHADYTVLEQMVNDVGGIDVDIVGDGANGIYDTNFDWDCPNGAYTCKNVYYPTNGEYHLNGTQALFLSRARADSGEYSYKDFGLDQGDFDRQANQQKVLIALEAKVKSASVLANPIALSNLLSAFGQNISTNISSGELKTFLTFAKSISSKNITQVSLVSSGNEVVTTGEIDGQSVVVPTSGDYDFSSISDYLTKQLSTNPAVAENATIGVYNASNTSGVASSEQTKLDATGLNVDNIGDASSSDIVGSSSYTLYDESNGKMPKTLAQLESSLKVKPTTSALPSDITASDDFVIVINK